MQTLKRSTVVRNPWDASPGASFLHNVARRLIGARFLCVFLAVPLFWLSSCSAHEEEAAVALETEWTTCKAAYLAEIDRSLNLILKELETHEASARNEGDLAKVKLIAESRTKFVEQGEIASSLPRAEYDAIRKNALDKLTADRKAVVTKSLQAKEDSIAELVDREFKELSQPIIADVQARWATAVNIYYKDVDDAKSLVMVQLERLEAKAREAGDAGAVEQIKQIKTAFVERGVLPTNVSTLPYESQCNKAKTQLAQVNKALVRTLLLNKHDDAAKVISDKLQVAASHSTPLSRGKASEAPKDTRKVWKNVTYNTVFYFRQGDSWDEINGAGKLERKVKELDRTDKYVEILLIDRSHLMRLYKNHADMFKDGRWQWIANGSWIEE